jgi:uncharacterized membrane protein YkgB
MDYAAQPENKLPYVADELQLLLAEKRTALSLLRTGITVFALPLSVLSLLVATSSNYRYSEVVGLLLPLLALSGALILLACYLVARAMVAVHRCDQRVIRLKADNRTLAALID